MVSHKNAGEPSFTRLVIYPMSGNNTTLKIDFTNLKK